MPKPINIEITESLEDLYKELKIARSTTLKKRLKCFILLKQGKVKYQTHLAAKVGATAKTVRGWINKYNTNGINELLNHRSGGNGVSVIGANIRLVIKNHLENTETTITSYVELQAILEAEHKETINYKTLYGYCRRTHSSKLKVARKSHYKGDEEEIELFKNATRPLNSI